MGKVCHRLGLYCFCLSPNSCLSQSGLCNHCPYWLPLLRSDEHWSQACREHQQAWACAHLQFMTSWKTLPEAEEGLKKIYATHMRIPSGSHHWIRDNWRCFWQTGKVQGCRKWYYQRRECANGGCCGTSSPPTYFWATAKFQRPCEWWAGAHNDQQWLGWLIAQLTLLDSYIIDRPANVGWQLDSYVIDSLANIGWSTLLWYKKAVRLAGVFERFMHNFVRDFIR